MGHKSVLWTVFIWLRIEYHDTKPSCFIKRKEPFEKLSDFSKIILLSGVTLAKLRFSLMTIIYEPLSHNINHLTFVMARIYTRVCGADEYVAWYFRVMLTSVRSVYIGFMWKQSSRVVSLIRRQVMCHITSVGALSNRSISGFKPRTKRNSIVLRDESAPARRRPCRIAATKGRGIGGEGSTNTSSYSSVKDRFFCSLCVHKEATMQTTSFVGWFFAPVKQMSFSVTQ